jgi:hypothetical protein
VVMEATGVDLEDMADTVSVHTVDGAMADLGHTALCLAWSMVTLTDMAWAGRLSIMQD